jgi:hypothetical protein
MDAARSYDAIDFSSFRQKAQQERLAYVGGVLSSTAPSLSPQAKRRVSLFAAAFVVATGAFWATMLTSPPQTEASAKPFSVLELQNAAALDLPAMTADAI